MKPRINIYGGPGVGKSTLAARIYADLRRDQISAELVREVVKDYVYAGRTLTPWEQVSIFGRQFDAEFLPLNAGVKHIVSDSPLFLRCIYGDLRNCKVNDELERMARGWDHQYPAVNLLLKRSDRLTFETNGRYQKGVAEAIGLDVRVKEYLDDEGIKYLEFDPLNDSHYHHTMKDYIEWPGHQPYKLEDPNEGEETDV